MEKPNMNTFLQTVTGGAIFLTCLTGLTSQAMASDQIPKGWFKAGNAPQHYSISKDSQTSANTVKTSIRIKSLPSAGVGFTTLMQSVQAKHYLGQRVRLSAQIKTDKLAGWGGLWMRIDGPGGKVLGFDNMQNRKIQGTLPWKPYAVVLDIPAGSEHIAFGVLVSGQGDLWLDSFKFEVVDKSVPVTGTLTESIGPQNLDFGD